MPESTPSRILLLALLGLALTGCANIEPKAYAGLNSAPYLKPDAHDLTGRTPYRYAAQVNWSDYKKVMIEPVAIYLNNDNQFGDMPSADRAALADYAQKAFTEKLRTRFEIVNTPAPATLRLKVTLTGATTTTPVLGTVSRFDIAGGMYNVVQTARGREGAFTGAVLYAVEIYDASSKQLLSAYVTKQYPNPYNLGASVGALNAAKTGIDKGADALLAQLR